MAKTTASRKKIATDPTATNSQIPTLTQEAIAQRAYALYEAGGRADGRDLDDWLQAEQELIEEKNGFALKQNRV